MERRNSKRTLELNRRNDVDLHDRLQHDRSSLGERLPERTLSGETESHLGGIDLVGRSVLENEFAAGDGVTGEDTAFEGVLETLSIEGESARA
jgi:hypothetical protein